MHWLHYLFTIPVLAAVSIGFWYNARLISPRLPALVLPASYLTANGNTYRRINSWGRSESGPNDSVTAVVLNWSRFSNVVNITSLLCTLDDVVSEVVVWNNNPEPLNYKNFSGSVCNPTKLKIHNSPANIYFQARFIACANSRSHFCFIQDDDYLIKPEIIRALYSRIISSKKPRSIHLLPPHEHLSSLSLTAYSGVRNIHTSFAWLGHGTIMHQSLSVSFLDLMEKSSFSGEEKKMADNYFTILRNDISEIWFDQGIALGGGEAFTVGSEGENRNRRHIHRATEYLDAMVTNGQRHDYVSSEYSTVSPTIHTACIGIPCVLSSNIDILHSPFNHLVSDATDLLINSVHNLDSMSPEDKERYLSHSLDRAVDGNGGTYFKSPHDAKSNDSITLDMTVPVGQQQREVEMSWLVSVGTTKILSKCVFESSVDSFKWVPTESHLQCYRLVDSDVSECSTRFFDHARYFRASLRTDMPGEHWIVFEIWMRTRI